MEDRFFETAQAMADAVDAAMQKLSGLGNARIGCGPTHPANPRPEREAEVRAFLDEFPFLRDDVGYVHYLQIYAGASVQSDATGLLIDVLGLDWDISWHLRDEESDVVDPDGFLMFATTQVRLRDPGQPLSLGASAMNDYLDMAWSFDASRTRPQGVYRHLGAGEPHYFCSGFATWITLLVNHQGRLENVASHPQGRLPGRLS